MAVLNLEDMYMVFYGASDRQGAKYSVVERWFFACAVIDGIMLSRDMFAHAFERVAPSRAPLSMIEFIELIGILSRETRQDPEYFVNRFQTVRQYIVDEIQAQYTADSNRRYS